MCKVCEELHRLAFGLTRLRFPFDAKSLPLNGIYVLFEKGEFGHNEDRIVRVGTHNGDNKLPSRLMEHFDRENKDRSIFRKNVGRAILNKNQDPFLKQWELDLTSREARKRLSSKIDIKRQWEIEHEVTSYIRQNLSFCAFPVKDKNRRLELESRMISTISLCCDCSASPVWLGRYSLVEKIRESGLWNVKGLYKKPLDERDMAELKASSERLC